MLSEFFFKRPITIIKDPQIQRQRVLRGFIAATLYSVIYGIYEYFVVYTGIRLIDHLGPIVNWTIMWSGLFITVTLATRLSFESIIMGLFYMSVLEDIVYWIGQWASTGVYPFPAGDWWDSYFASYRVLGGWGQAIPVWPYVPFYYVPSITMLLIYYLSAHKGALYGRLVAWLVGPIFIGIILGAFVNDFTATLILVFVPFAMLAYAFALTHWSLHKSTANSRTQS